MGSDLAAASQVDVALVSQDGEPTVEESVAMDGNELIDDLVFSHKFLAFAHRPPVASYVA